MTAYSSYPKKNTHTTQNNKNNPRYSVSLINKSIIIHDYLTQTNNILHKYMHTQKYSKLIIREGIPCTESHRCVRSMGNYTACSKI